MARIIEYVVIDKPANTTPVDITGVFTTPITSSHGMIVVLCLDSSTHTYTLSESITKIDLGDTGNAGGALYYWFKETDVDTITSLTLSNSADGHYQLYLIDGHDQATMIDSSAGTNSGNSVTHTTPSLTTIANNTLIFESIMVDRNFTPIESSWTGGTLVHSGGGEEFTGVSAITAFSFAPVGGSFVGGNSITFSGTDGGGQATIAIRDANPSDPTIPIIIKQKAVNNISTSGDFDGRIGDIFQEPIDTTAKTSLVIDMTTVGVDNDFVITSHGYASWDAVLCTVSTNANFIVGTTYKVIRVDDNNIKFRDHSSTSSKSLPQPQTGSVTLIHTAVLFDVVSVNIGLGKNISGTTNHVIGGLSFSSNQDLSSSVIVATINLVSTIEVRTIEANGLVIVAIDSSGNWRSFKAGGSDSIIDIEVDHNIYIDLASGEELKTSGAFDSTSITALAYGVKTSKDSRTPAGDILSVGILSSLIVTGGTISPVTMSAVGSLSDQVSVLGGALAFVEAPMVIGDGGTTKTTFRSPSGAVAMTLPTDQVTQCTVQTLPGLFGLTIDCGSLDDVIFNVPLIAEFFTITGDEPAAYDFDGATIKCPNAVTLPSWLVSSGISFDGCANIVHAESNVSGATIQSSSDVTGAITWTTTLAWNNATFANNEYHIKIEAAGTYTLTGHSYSNSGTADINVTASSGTVTINVSGGGDTPTFTTAGATVNVIAGALLEFTGLIDATEVRVFTGTDPQTSVEIGGIESTSGGTFSMSHSDSGVDGYVIIHSLGYNSIYLPITFSSADTSIPIQQQFDRNYSNP